jgi:hypothetical protein
VSAPPFVQGLRGARVALDDIDPSSAAVEGWLMLRGREPLALARALGALTGADLSALRDGGPPVPLAIPFLSEARIAAKGDVLAVSVGRRTATRTASLLDPGPGRAAPLLRFAYDYGRLSSVLAKAMPSAAPGGFGAMARAMNGFGSIVYEMTIDRAGLLVSMDMTMAAK